MFQRCIIAHGAKQVIAHHSCGNQNLAIALQFWLMPGLKLPFMVPATARGPIAFARRNQSLHAVVDEVFTITRNRHASYSLYCVRGRALAVLGLSGNCLTAIRASAPKSCCTAAAKFAGRGACPWRRPSKLRPTFAGKVMVYRTAAPRGSRPRHVLSGNLGSGYAGGNDLLQPAMSDDHARVEFFSP